VIGDGGAEEWHPLQDRDTAGRSAAIQIARVAADFVDLVAWQEAVALVCEVVRPAPQVRGVGAVHVVDQMLRAAESVPANIAEGYGHGLGRDFARFLRVAAASAAELESHVLVAEASGRLGADSCRPLVARSRRVRALVGGLRKCVNRRGAD
jgi:four helix bundle protein